MKFFKFYLSIIVAIALGACMVSCSDDEDDDESSSVTDDESSSANYAGEIAGTYEGTVSVLFAYISDPMLNTGDVITIEEVNDTTVSITYTGTTWGTGTFDEVAVTKSGSSYVLEGSGALSMASHSGGTTDYDATIEGTITADDDFEITVSVPDVMGGTVITFAPTVIADYVVGDYDGLGTVVFAYGTLDGDTCAISITKNSDTTVDIVYESDTWGTAELTDVEVVESDDAYTLSGTSTIAMASHSGSTTDYDITFDATIVSTDEFEFVIDVPDVMGGTTITVVPL